jgi:alpha-D-ribose 1-methylphosphonate 5-triphosphate diphosphatase
MPATDTPSRRGSIVNGSVLRPDDDLPAPGTVVWSGAVIDTVSTEQPTDTADLDPARLDTTVIDAAGGWILPGIVDIHGDAFERSVMPRPGVMVDIDLALADNDAQLLATGITTSYLSVTDSWEPGLRSREMLHQLVAGLERRRGDPTVLLHVRHERCNTDGLDELESLIASGTIKLLSFNDHTADSTATATHIMEIQVQRAGVDRSVLEELQAAAVARRPLGFDQEARLAEIAAAASCPIASHDPADQDDLDHDIALGVAIAEFPTSIPLAKQYLAAGIDVLLGAPNLTRGRSHLGNLSVRDALGSGAATLLCSDYHHPSLLQAPYVSWAEGLQPFGAAWATVSAAPARAVGLTDRGRIEPSARADLVVVDPPDGGPARARATIVGGRLSYLAP